MVFITSSMWLMKAFQNILFGPLLSLACPRACGKGNCQERRDVVKLESVFKAALVFRLGDDIGC